MVKPRDIPFRCACGTLTGVLQGVSPSTGTHASCFCSDCRAAEIFCDQQDPAPEPVAFFQLTPDRVRFETGYDQLAVFSFGPKNLLRWRAACCGVPLFITPRSPKIAFTGVRTNLLAETDALGPIVARAFVPQPGGKQKTEGGARFVIGVFSRIVSAFISGKWKNTPFFDIDAKKPVQPVYVLSREERRAILPR